MAFGLGIDFALYVFINERFPHTVTINKVCGIESQKFALTGRQRALLHDQSTVVFCSNYRFVRVTLPTSPPSTLANKKIMREPSSHIVIIQETTWHKKHPIVRLMKHSKEER